LKPQEDALQWMRIVVRTYEDLLASAAGLDWPPYALDELTRLQRDAGGLNPEDPAEASRLSSSIRVVWFLAMALTVSVLLIDD
jgi:hypothetical protein